MIPINERIKLLQLQLEVEMLFQQLSLIKTEPKVLVNSSHSHPLIQETCQQFQPVFNY